jgi:hypothetical protein
MKTRPTVLFCLLTVVCIASVFWSTLTGHTAISRFNLIQQLDVLSNPALQGTGLNVAWDPSACLQSIPKAVFIRQSFLHGQCPVWNPHSGCGQPIIADPANTVWAPLDLIFAPDASDQRMYNFGLVFKIILGGVFAYLYFFGSGANPWAASTAAIGFALSVRVLRGVELATNFEIVPAIFLIFQNLPGKPSWKQVSLSALGLALCYLSLHVEVFFVAVLSASFLWFFQAPNAQDISESPDSGSKKNCSGEVTYGRRVFYLCALALISVAMVAPFLFPFIEYLGHAHSYKYDGASIEFIPWTQFVFFLLIPLISGAFFPGWVVLLGLPFGLIRFFKKTPASAPLLIALVLFACRPAPLELIFSKAPFSYLLPEYTLGTILLIICSAASIGLTELANSTKRPPVQRVLIAFATLAILIIPLLWFSKNTIALGMLHVSINSKFVTGSALTLLGALLAIMLLPPRLILTQIVLVALPVLNLVALWAPAKAELPLSKPISLPIQSRMSLFTRLESDRDARIVACGSGILPPSSNLLYGLADLRTCSPLNSFRYMKFMQQMGATLGYCNMVELPSSLNHLVDIGGVNLIISSNPLPSDETCAAKNEQTGTISGHILPGLRLLQADCTYYPGSAEIKVNLQFRIHQSISSRYQAQVVLCNAQLREIWRGAPRVLASSQAPQVSKGQNSEELQSFSHKRTINWDLPAPTKNESTAKVVLLVYDTWSGSFIIPDGDTFTSNLSGNKLQLASFRLSSPAKIETNDGHFELCDETRDLLRVYRNKKARPHAYLAHHAIPVENSDEALKLIARANFDPATEVVLEAKGNEFPASLFIPVQSQDDEVKTLKLENTELEFQCKTKAMAILVLTDSSDPGWQAYVDESRVDVYAANCLFRAVKVPPGKHVVKFKYVSATLVLGQLLSFLSGVLLLVSIFRRKRYLN